MRLWRDIDIHKSRNVSVVEDFIKKSTAFVPLRRYISHMGLSHSLDLIEDLAIRMHLERRETQKCLETTSIQGARR